MSALSYFGFDEPNGSASCRDFISGADLAVTRNGTNDATAITLGQRRLLNGDYGTSARFDAANSAYIVGNSASIGRVARNVGTKPLSCMFTIVPNVTRSGASTRYAVWSTGASGTGIEVALQWHSGLAICYISVRVMTSWTNWVHAECKATDMPNGVAHHVAVSYDGSLTFAGVKIWVNGSLVTATNSQDNATGASMVEDKTFRIGSSVLQNGSFLSAWLDELSFHDVALTPAFVAAAYAAAAPSRPVAAPPIVPNLIHVDDMISDVDGLIGLAIAMVMHREGTLRLKHVSSIATVADETTGLRAFLDHYGFPQTGDFMLSSQRSSTYHTTAASTGSALVSAYGSATDSHDAYIGSTSGIRKALSECADNSVVLHWGAMSTELAALLKSTPDVYSGLTGAALIARKCMRILLGGGVYPSGTETNFSTDPASAQYVMLNIPTSVEVILLDYPTGSPVATGSSAVGALRLAIDNWGTTHPGSVIGGARVGSWGACASYIAAFGFQGGGLFQPAAGRGRLVVAGDGSTTFSVGDMSYDHVFHANALSTSAISATLEAYISRLGA